MLNDHEAADRDRSPLLQQLAPDTEGNPAAPPPMPTAAPRHRRPASAAPVPAEDKSKPAESGGWEVDPDRLDWFTDVVRDARRRLRDVQDKVDRMQSAAYTPRLGISPVGKQLEQKFLDRLDAALDNPQQPTTGGLRPMLAEAVRRMDEFIAGAEAAAMEYRELDESAARNVTAAGQDPAGKKG
ncbi:MAG TPA: hypothetical protein VGX25_21045 [Actinophytocola sp.]|uniref:hypothetical protein n=1 Tax=Actinophytocola sp. TaxID=1872138 RepID=UPI002DDCEFE6|nr:hypothetical protein [Actinophytocola sp.]HEV2781882.1 hypothetical protein [Actinophytocola sp.]